MERDTGAKLLQELHESAQQTRLTIPQNLPLIATHLAGEKGRLGDIDGAIRLARMALDDYYRSGELHLARE